MTERRRNLFVLLFVAGLAIASLVIVLNKPGRLGLDLRGGVELTLQARGTATQPVVDQESLDRTIDILRKRVDPQGILEPEIQRSGTDQLTIAIPGFQNPGEARRLVGKTARLFFYDWEPNVIGPDGVPEPDNADVTGNNTATGPGGSGSGIPLFEAVQRAAKQPREVHPNRAHDDLLYLVDKKNKKVIDGPETVEEDLFSDEPAVEAQQRKDYELVTVPAGTTIVQSDAPSATGSNKNAKDNDGKRKDSWYVLRDKVSLEGTDIKDPVQNFDEFNAPAVSFDFTSEGRKIWEDVTKTIAERGQENLVGNNGDAAAQHFAIVLDNQLISVPSIDPIKYPTGISSANGSQISGSFTIQSAQELATLLRTGALPVELRVISETQITASLGRQALDQGLVAGLAGFAVVALFLLIFYRVLGVLAIAGLLLYTLFLYALVKIIPITMTLPGIAGLILTIGVAADANIVIFERIKEELRMGRSVQASIATGYKRGLTAIVDANVVTFVVAFILFTLATAGVKGFAFILGVGTLVSFFTAVVFTQAVLGLVGRSKLITGKAALGAGKQKGPRKFDFMGRSKLFFSGSGLILVVGALAIGANGIPLGIDFESGTRISAGTTKPATEEQVRAVVAEQGIPSPKVQRENNAALGESSFQITTEDLSGDKLDALRAALDEEFGVGDKFSSQTVGPTFGEQIASTAIVAIIASLFVISGYIALRFEWKYAVPVLIAITHDILIVGGVYALLGAEVSSSTVAALLTILGYSLYDTIIVFDRIRENVPRMPRATYSQIVNQSMSEVLTRSLATSFCTLLPVLALYAFGGETLRDFALALIIGTVSGTYSSIFIASPVLVHWKERETVWKRRTKAVASDHGGQLLAYADGPKSALVDNAPTGPVRLSSDQADQVSPEEFEAMVRDLGIDEQAAARSSRAATRSGVAPAPQAAEEVVDENDPASVRRAEARRRREQRRNRTEGDA